MNSTIVIMAAGRGTRMEGLAPDVPKHMLPVAGRPFFEYTLERVRSAGFNDIVVVVGHKAEAFDRYKQEADVRIIKQDLANGRYGTAAVIERVASEITGSFGCIAGDNLYAVSDLQKIRIDSPTCWIGGFRTAAWQGMGVLHLNGEGYLDKIIEKPTTFVGDLVNASLYHFSPTIFQAVKEIGPSPRGEYELTDAINLVAAKELVNVFELEERWHDLTRPSDIEKIAKALQE